MAHYLMIETCTERGVIAYGSQDEILFQQELPFGLNQSKFLLPSLTNALKDYGAIPNLAAIGVGMGPGSYTGIRIGVAIAQALAYSWKAPLIGVPSLVGYVPSQAGVDFAAVLDARIGGLYFQKGKCVKGKVFFEDEPKVCSLEEAGSQLESVTHLVSPHRKTLQAKLSILYPHANWIWEEHAPSAKMLLQAVEDKLFQNKGIIPPEHLDLLYLRKTEAEREKLLQKSP